MKKTLLFVAALAMTLCASAADKTWDFTNFSEATITNLKADAANWKYTSAATYERYANSTATVVAQTASPVANGVAIAELDGLLFLGQLNKASDATSISALAADRVRIDIYPEDRDKVNYNGGRYAIAIPATVGQYVTVNGITSTAGEARGISLAYGSASGQGTADIISGEEVSADEVNVVYKVTGLSSSANVANMPDGYFVIATTAGFGFFKIAVTDEDPSSSSIDAAAADKGAIVSSVSYDALGRKVSDDAKGLIIKKVTYENGVTETIKEIVK